MSDHIPVQLTPRCKAEQTVMGHIEALLRVALGEQINSFGGSILTGMRLKKKVPLLKVHIMCIKNAIATMEEEIRG